MIKRFDVTLIFVLMILIMSCKDSTDNISVLSSPDLSEHPLYSSYNFGKDDSIIDIGIQPLSIPAGIIGDLFGHDGVLLKSLSELGYEIRIHSFFKSADSNFFLERGDLEFVTGGDMPAIIASADMDVTITSLVNFGFSSIIAKNIMLISDLKRKKIGYPSMSKAHFALLETLHSAGLTEENVHLIPMPLLEMEDALDKGSIDAFTTWEPNTTIALARHEDFVVLHRSLNISYLYFAKSFVEKEPEITRLIIASQIRSMGWLRSSNANLQSAVRWMEERRKKMDSEIESGDINRYSYIIKSDLLDVSAVGALPITGSEESGVLYREFMFLKYQGKIADDADWEKVKDSFDPSLLNEVLENSNYYSLWNYDYSEIPSANVGMVVN